MIFLFYQQIDDESDDEKKKGLVMIWGSLPLRQEGRIAFEAIFPFVSMLLGCPRNQNAWHEWRRERKGERE